MEAILLAGGLGTRLRSVVNDRPKPMALIEGKPFMEYVIQGLKKQGIDRVIFAVGYKGSMVEAYFKDGSGLGIHVSYSYEEELLGTAGAIKQAGQMIEGDYFFVLNADTFYQIDYGSLIQIQREQNLDMSLVLRQVQDVSRYGEATLKDGYLIGFNEKTSSARSGTINGGIYYMKRELLSQIPKGKVSLENEMIPLWLEQKKALGGIVNGGYFVDIGVPDDYFQFVEDVKGGIITW